MPLPLEFMVDTGVVFTERTYTDDCYANWTSVMQALILSDSNERRKDYHLLKGGTPMSQFFRLSTLLIVLGAGAFVYMRQAQSATAAGSENPQGTVDIVGVKHDLVAIVRAERVHSALHGGYGSIDELRSSNDLSMERNSRGPYNYSVEFNASTFRVTATNSGPAGAMAPRVISVDQNMQFSEE
jgi:hypothetical protein